MLNAVLVLVLLSSSVWISSSYFPKTVNNLCGRFFFINSFLLGKMAKCQSLSTLVALSAHANEANLIDTIKQALVKIVYMFYFT